jgi:hypothetical protein
MAESVKRRVAAARLAVAFVAAGTIAGATAWAQADPPPPVAQSSARGQHIKKATLQLKSENIVDGSLLFKDFKKFEVPSYKHFQKVELDWRSYKKATLSDISTIKGEIGDIKSQLGSYIKGESKDFIKSSEDVVRGKGSVFTATQALSTGSDPVTLLSLPNLIKVEGTDLLIEVTNTSNGELSHSACGQGSSVGILQPGESFSCASGAHSETVQLIVAGQVMTLNFSILPLGVVNASQATVQILIGL